MSMHMSDTVAVAPGDQRGRYLFAGGTVIDVVLGTEQTGGHISLMDQWMVRGDATPRHVHQEESEIFYVLDGTIRAFDGDRAVDLDAGGAIYLPARREHAFGVLSERARLIVIATPGSFADFVRIAGVEVPVDEDVPTQWDFDLGRIMEAAPRFGIEITGPPPSLD